MRRFLKAPRLAARLALDGAMVALFVTALAFRATGREAHEWIGVSFCLLFLVHTLWNWTWYTNLLAGRYTVRRAINASTNLALVAAMAALCVCGIVTSRHIFGFSHLIDGEHVRQIHTVAAYWCLVLVGVHTGLHWEMIMGIVRKPFGSGGTGTVAVHMTRTLAVVVVGFGVWASCERDMASKLFLGFSFDFWSPERPLALFYACNLAIAGVYVLLGRSLSHAAHMVFRKQSRPVGNASNATQTE